MWNYSNNSVETTLTGSIDASATNIAVASTAGLPVTYPYTLVLDYQQANAEVVTVTGAAGTTLTVTRGEDGTSATSHSTGAVVVHAVVARDVREPQQHIEASGDVHGVGASAAVVGTTTTQTLTNKTISGATNTLQQLPAAELTGTWAAASVGSVTATGNYSATRTALDQQVFASRLSGDAHVRFAIQAEGDMFWGPGTAASDVKLYRSAADTLKTDDTLEVVGAINVDGPINGEDQISVTRSAATNTALRTLATGDTVARLSVQADGKVEWGAGGSSVRDVNLYRSAANVLKTDDTLEAAALTATGNVTTNGHRAHYGLSGVVNVSFTSAISSTVAVVFPTAFASEPKVFTNIDNSPASTARWSSRAINITTTGFTMFVFSCEGIANTWTSIPVSWSAFAA